MRYIILFLLLFSLSFAATTADISYPLNASTERLHNLTVTYSCSDGSAPYTANLYINESLADTAVVAEADPTTAVFDLSSGIYNITAECDDGADLDNATVRVGFYKLQTFTANVSIDAFTYDSFLSYVKNYMSDYFAYAAAIFCYGCAFLVTRNMQQTMFAGALGLLAIFFITGTGIFFVGSVFSLAVGFLLKYTGG